MRSRTEPLLWRQAVACLAIASLSVGLFSAGVHAGPQRIGSIPTIRTKPLVPALDSFAEAFFAFENQARATGGKGSAEATKRLAEVERLSAAFKAEIKSFVSRLRQANEAEAFEAMVFQRAGESGRATLGAEIRQEGGPLAILGKAETLLEQLLAERRVAIKTGSTAPLLERIGLVATVHAGFLTTVCGAFWFTISVGYADRIAYRSCYY